ncbi:hypothetical protein [Mycobacterium sp. DL440]|uniref:hypothetical protein n=1 Tax=Mycobacterium sp. DL440 TaxID=2675523 RepID=UPI00141DB3C8|nr:hypothetical protein [Mycobacterium sp. DL440]
MTNPDPDAAESAGKTATHTICQQVVDLYTLAHQEGVRNGLEAAAQFLAEHAKQVADNYELDTAWRITVSAYLEHLRDCMRLISLQVPDPEAGT